MYRKHVPLSTDTGPYNLGFLAVTCLAYISFSPLRWCHMNSKQQLIAAVKTKKKKAFSLISVSTPLSPHSFFNLFIMDFVMQHTKGFLLIKAQSDFFVKGFSWCPFAPSPYHSLEYFLPLPSCTSIKVQCLEISCSYVAC